MCNCLGLALFMATFTFCSVAEPVEKSHWIILVWNGRSAVPSKESHLFGNWAWTACVITGTGKGGCSGDTGDPPSWCWQDPYLSMHPKLKFKKLNHITTNACVWTTRRTGVTWGTNLQRVPPEMMCNAACEIKSCELLWTLWKTCENNLIRLRLGWKQRGTFQLRQWRRRINCLSHRFHKP